MASSRSLYDVLNVSQQAEGVVIEAAYRALMKKYHPDQAGQARAAADAAEINKAFEVLKDPARRADYDHRLWAKQQAIRLAELNGLDPGRGSRLFGWSGWLMAVLLGCAAAAIAVAKDLAPKVPASVIAAAADQDRAEPGRAAAIKAASAEEVIVHPSSELILARVRAQANPPLLAEGREPVTSAVSRPLAPPAREAKRQKRRHAAKASPKERADFLEREGYIY